MVGALGASLAKREMEGKRKKKRLGLGRKQGRRYCWAKRRLVLPENERGKQLKQVMLRGSSSGGGREERKKKKKRKKKEIGREKREENGENEVCFLFLEYIACRVFCKKF